MATKLFTAINKFTDEKSLDVFLEEKKLEGSSIVSKLKILALKSIENTKDFADQTKILLYKQIGKALDKWIKSDNTYVTYMSEIRKKIEDNNGSLELIKKSGISNSKRTEKKNNTQMKKVEAIQLNASVFTVEEIQKIAEKIINDLDENSINIILLTILLTGSRINEVVSFSEFSLVKNKSNPEYFIQKNVAKKLDKSISIERPLLPYYNGKELFQRLDQWRVDNNVVVGTQNTKIINSLNTKVNRQLKKYMKKPIEPDNIDKSRAPSSHFLRKMYINLVHKLYAPNTSTLSGSIKKWFQHESLSTSMNYNNLNIIEKPCLPCPILEEKKEEKKEEVKSDRILRSMKKK